MTDHTCTPGCTECDRAERIAMLADRMDSPTYAAEIRALNAQREALTQEVARLREALHRYEQALVAAFPRGTIRPAFEHWNEARKIVMYEKRELPWEHWKPEDKP